VIPAPLRTQVREAIARAWDAAIESGALPALPDEPTKPAIEVEHPADPSHGDLATNLAMKLARTYRKAPMEIATVLAAKLVRDASSAVAASPVEAAEVAPPGFVNIRIRAAALEAIVDGILAEPVAWGHVAPISERKVNVEFVSANPTGPLTIGNARGAFIGDLLSRVLEAGGQHVTREYYFNDSGGQIDQLGASVAAITRGEAVPENGYQGEYVNDLAAALPDDIWSAATGPDADTANVVGRWAAGAVREQIEASL
jgi:arginyl-tRNA synthetase